MTNILNKKRKKKGFTLIELVIVLAVLAIIALIAIPNFTKVRNDSLTKADQRTAEQIRKISLMAIADGDIKAEAVNYVVTFDNNKKIAGFSVAQGTASTGIKLENVKTMMNEVKAPQVNGEDDYVVVVDANGNVSVGYSDDGKTISEKLAE